MRDAFHEELDPICDELVEMTRLVGSAIDRATTALLDADLTPRRERHRRRRADRRHPARARRARSIDLLARQQPVATDLRIVVTALRMSADLERMGDLARHVAKLARLRFPDSAVPPDLHAPSCEMGQLAERIVAKAGAVIASQGRRRSPLQLEKDDDDDGRAAPQLFPHLLGDRWPHGIETAVDVTLRRPLLRAVRRPRRVASPAGRLPGHRRVASTTAIVGWRERRPAHTAGAHGRCGRPARAQRPWLATALMASAAASGSRYLPPGLVGSQVRVERRRRSGMPVGMLRPAMSCVGRCRRGA